MADLLHYKLGSVGSVCLPLILAVSLKSSLIGTVHMYRARTETCLQIRDAVLMCTETWVDFNVKWPWRMWDLYIQIEISWQLFCKILHINFNGNLFCGSQCVICVQMVGRMHRAVLIDVFGGCKYMFAVLHVLIYVEILGMISQMYRVTWMRKLHV